MSSRRKYLDSRHWRAVAATGAGPGVPPPGISSDLKPLDLMPTPPQPRALFPTFSLDPKKSTRELRQEARTAYIDGLLAKAGVRPRRRR